MSYKPQMLTSIRVPYTQICTGVRFEKLRDLNDLSTNQDSVNLERVSGLAQHAVGAALPSTTATPPSQPHPTSFTRYWHDQPTSSLTSQNRNTTQTKPLKSQPNQTPLKAKVRPAMDMSVFQSPISSNAVTTIELIKTEELGSVVELHSSDDDEVVEVALPPKPTITIESSDDEPDVIETPLVASTPETDKQTERAATVVRRTKKKQKNKRRAASTSPVPSVLSSISDDFIRGDCAAFNISRKPEQHNFDLNLHGADLIDSESNNSLTPKIKKKKNKQKSKDRSPPSNQRVETHTMVAPSPPSPQVAVQDQCFTTPKSKANRKYDKSKNYLVSEQSIPDPDIYETDSNQSLPVPNIPENPVALLDLSEPTEQRPQQVTQQASAQCEAHNEDSTNVECETYQNPTPIEDNLIMGNVTGLESTLNTTSTLELSRGRAGSLGAPSESLQQSHFEMNAISDIPMLSRSIYRREMERFYNESWGGEDFDHYEILRGMSRDKRLWAIDPRDRMPSGHQKRRCHYCNHVGHGYDRCRLKPRVCHMCGAEGHQEPRCPKSMCLKCGSPNGIFSISCRNCANWNRIFCAVCQNFGHPVKDCPDLWRRYHSTVENNGVLVIQNGQKKPDELHCSGCTRRGHLAHSCYAIPYSGLPLHSPYVAKYTPLFPPSHGVPTVSSSGRYFTLDQHGDESGFRNLSHHNQHPPQFQQKRLSASPITTDNGAKKRNVSNSETHNQSETPQKLDDSDVVSSTTGATEVVLQDCEVSNTSEVITTAKIYIEKIVLDELRKPEGVNWLALVSAHFLVEVIVLEQPTTFLNVKGLPADQEAFQGELKNWAQKLKDGRENAPEIPIPNAVDLEMKMDFSKDIPKKRLGALQMMNRALSFLQSDLGDPKTIYKELEFLKRNHKQVLKKKVISQKTLSNSRTKINEMLKNLNMILVGQAGLAGGNKHLGELYSMQSMLTSSRKHVLPNNLRNKIGIHYHYIFSSVAREDYPELMSQYYNKPVHAVELQNNSLNKRGKRKAAQRLKIKDTRNQVKNANENAEDVHNVDNYMSVNGAIDKSTEPARSKEHTIDQIQSCQKKLRKWNVGSGENDQWRHVLLTRLRKFQVQVKQRGLFQKQYIQLDKLMAEVKKFFGEF